MRVRVHPGTGMREEHGTSRVPGTFMTFKHTHIHECVLHI